MKRPSAILSLVSARVLVVEDVAVTRVMLEAGLGGFVAELLFAEDGHEGLRLAVEQAPDVILLDLMMPGMDGLSVAAELRRDPRSSHIPIVLSTALNRDQVRDKAMAVGIDCILQKPVAPQEVRAAIAELLQGQESR